MSESSMPMSEHIEELMAGYVLNTLSPGEVEEFEQILQENPEIISKMTELRELMGLVAYAPPRVSAPQHLRSKALEVTRSPLSAPAAMPTEQIKQPLLKPTFVWSRVAMAVASVLVLFLGADNYRLHQRLALMQTKLIIFQEQEQKRDRADFALRGTQGAAEGRILLDVKSGRALISLKNLSPAPTGTSYSLWAFMENKKVLCGTFNPSSSGRILDEMAISPKEYPSPILFVRVSKESADSNQKWVMTSER
jgi:anti-sigma-K factor RskA